MPFMAMGKGAQLPHGEEKVCRQQDNQQTAGQRDMVIYNCVTAMITPSAAPP